ncbi:MAG: T9SS type A sorting domain-containing protein, partial [Bacteroidota bacterium]
GEVVESHTITPPLLPNQSTVVNLGTLGITTQGLNAQEVHIAAVNGFPDGNLENNRAQQYTWVGSEEINIPFRVQEPNELADWPTYASRAAGQDWEQFSTATGTAWRYNAYDDAQVGNQAVLVSPILDTRGVDALGLAFQTSYASVPHRSEELALWVSEDGGTTWRESSWTQAGPQLATTTSFAPWVPLVSTDWQDHFVSLSAYAGLEKLRLAWVATNGHGQRLYLRNLELFLDDNPNPFPVGTTLPMAVWPVPSDQNTVQVTLALETVEAVSLQVVSSRGDILYTLEESRGLNQTYSIDASQWQAGVYFVRMLGEQTSYTTRMVLLR